MNASVLSAANTVTAAPPLLGVRPGHAGAAPLTRVSLAYVEPRINLYLRFGEPTHILRLDRWRRVALFLPGAVFCRIRWHANDYGTVRWQLMVMQACSRLDSAQRIPGVLPGARFCCTPKANRPCAPYCHRSTPSRRRASRLLPRRQHTGECWAIGSLRACRCPPTPASGTSPGWPGGRCHDDRMHCRHYAASSFALARSHRAGGLVRLRPCCTGLGVLRAARPWRDLQRFGQRGGRLVSRRSAGMVGRLAAGRQLRADPVASRRRRASRAARVPTDACSAT